MDELSPKARELLQLVEQGHDPPLGASDRVWQAVSSDLAQGVNVEAARVAKHTGSAGTNAGAFSSRVLWGTGVIAGASLCAMALLRLPPRSQPPAASTGASVVQQQAQSESGPALDEPGESPPADRPLPFGPAQSPVTASKRAAAQPPDTLLQEVAALRRAADELAADHPAQALVLLRGHERKFATGALQEEREALVLLARCTLEPGAVVSLARAFIARAPHAVLRSRIETTCKLDEE